VSLAPHQIIAGSTETAVADVIIGYLRDAGFRTTSWQDGSIQKTLIRSVSRPVSSVLSVFSEVLDRMLVNPSGDSAGAWQDLVGTYWYQLPRLEAVRTLREVTYTAAASAPPHVVTEGSQFTADGVAFEVFDGVPSTPLAAGASITLGARALVAGTSGNVAEDATCRAVTPYAGVTITLDGDPTTAGTDRETNVRYQTRLDLRWSEMTYSIGIRAYELWALTSDGSINRVRAWGNSPDPNSIKIAVEPGTPSQLAAVDAYVAGRMALNDDPEAVIASANPQTITARPRIRAGTTTVAQLEAAWTAYLDAMPLGGVLIAGASNGRLLREKLTQIALCTLDGVESVDLQTPAADVILGATDYIVPTYDIVPEWIS
jgi:phage-related baseplate assembly protein